MSELEDNDSLSRLFQKAAQQPPIRFEESDWKKLEALLDAEQSKINPGTRFSGRAIMVSVVVILLFSFSTYVFISHDSNDRVIKTHDRIDADSVHNTLSDFKVDSQSEITKAIAPRSSTQALGEDASKLPGERIKLSIDQNPGQRTGPLWKAIDRSSEENAVQPIVSVYSRGVKSNLSVDSMAPLKKSINSQMVELSLDKSTADLSLPANSTDNLPVQMAAHAPTKLMGLGNTDSIPDVDERTFVSRWSVLLTLSPDFSSTGFRKFTSPGESFGITVSYRINDMLSVTAGAIKSNKKYQDYGSNYTPKNKKLWANTTNGIIPKEIRGSCSVLEIPMGLQYRIKHRQVSSMYVAAELSSYVMLKETYQYIFDTPNPGAAESWDAKEKTYSLFNMVNFSVGYERSISKQLFFGISPYIKIPMTDIGSWANIKLYSVGAAFTFRYNLKKNRSDSDNYNVSMN